MIVYDSHKCGTFWSIKGSIFPKALLFALPSTVFAFCIKYFDWFELGQLDNEVGNGTIYSGFTFVLGFILVFRTSQSYQRYWLAATAVHTMRAEWFDACGSLCAFVQITKKGKETINEFTHVIVRLFGLLHAMALEEIASVGDENFPLLDVAGLRKTDLRVLTSEAAQGRKVEIVSQWIKTYVVKAHEDGILPVPAPILTRVFQELGTGLVHYHEALQVVIWPFPFPYAQMSAVLITVYMVVTPVVICLWTKYAWYACIATLMSVVCMKGIDEIAIELENPFGDDPNDLPTFRMHHEMNRDLVLLLNPQTWTIPQLTPGYINCYKTMLAQLKSDQLSLKQYYEAEQKRPVPLLTTVRTMFFGDKGAHAKADVQSDWAKQDFRARKSRTMRVLHMENMSSASSLSSETMEAEDDAEVVIQTETPMMKRADSFRTRGMSGSCELGFGKFQSLESSVSVPGKFQPALETITSGALFGEESYEPPATLEHMASVSEETLVQPLIGRPPAMEKTSTDPAKQLLWGDFLEDLSGQWRQFLREQLEQQDRVNQRHVNTLERLLCQPGVEAGIETEKHPKALLTAEVDQSHFSTLRSSAFASPKQARGTSKPRHDLISLEQKDLRTSSNGSSSLHVRAALLEHGKDEQWPEAMC